MDDIIWFHDFLLWIIVAITLFVLALLVIVVVKFNARANPVPSRTTHNTILEVIWTVVPVIILVTIAVPSFRLLFYQLNTPKPDVTVKAIGKQWFWTYEYPDEQVRVRLADGAGEGLKAGQPRLLAVDNEIVVPVNKIVKVLTTGADVIHSWAVPSFGVKIDAVPGRLNETWFKAEREGTYYGQCSELCGARPRLHADRGACGERTGLYGVARRRQEEVRLTDDSARPTAVAAAGDAKCTIIRATRTQGSKDDNDG